MRMSRSDPAVQTIKERLAVARIGVIVKGVADIDILQTANSLAAIHTGTPPVCAVGNPTP
jgi:hypothetical protein